MARTAPLINEAPRSGNVWGCGGVTPRPGRLTPSERDPGSRYKLCGPQRQSGGCGSPTAAHEKFGPLQTQRSIRSDLRQEVEYSPAPHNDVSVNDGPHVRRWSHKIIIL